MWSDSSAEVSAALFLGRSCHFLTALLTLRPEGRCCQMLHNYIKATWIIFMVISFIQDKYVYIIFCILIVCIALTSERWCAHTVVRSVFSQYLWIAKLAAILAVMKVESVGPKAVSQLLSHGCQSNGWVSVLVLKVFEVTFWCFSCASSKAAGCWSRWTTTLVRVAILLPWF